MEKMKKSNSYFIIYVTFFSQNLEYYIYYLFSVAHYYYSQVPILFEFWNNSDNHNLNQNNYFIILLGFMAK